MNAIGIDLVELLTGDVNRLRYIRRFGTALTLHKENVAEHSFYVAIYGYFIAVWVNNHTDSVVDVMSVMEAAIFHDLEECRTGDFPRPFKYRRPELKALLDDAAKGEFSSIVRTIIPSQEAVDGLTEVWDNARNEETLEGCVLSLADYLSVISHLWQEVNSSNASMYYHYSSVMEYLATFDSHHYDFMRPMIDEVGKITRAVFDRSKQGNLHV